MRGIRRYARVLACHARDASRLRSVRGNEQKFADHEKEEKGADDEAGRRGWAPSWLASSERVAFVPKVLGTLPRGFASRGEEVLNLV